jgi:hypothetical protein
MAETIVLDPAAAIAGRAQLDITAWVDADPGVDWGDAAITAYMADQQIGSSPVDYRLPNRQIKIPLNLRSLGATTYTQIRLSLQHKVGLMQREGGAIMRQVDSTALYADVVNATLHLGGSILAAFRSIDVDAVLSLECLPDFYGDEVTLDAITATAVINAKLQQSSVDAIIAGNYGGRARVILTEASANDQKAVIWGLRSRHYDSASSAALVSEGETWTGLNGSASGVLSGASGGNALTNAALPLRAWCPVATKTFTHVGTYRVWARVYTPTLNSPPSLRLAWSIGDTATPLVTYNDAVTFARVGAFYLVSLGTVRLAAPAAGTYQWVATIQAYAPATSAISIDVVCFQPLDEAAGVAVASVGIDQGSASYIAFDGFNQGTVSLNGQAAVLGGNWATTGGSGDFQVIPAAGVGLAQRSSTGDTLHAGRFAAVGSAAAATVVQIDVLSSGSIGVFQGVLARYTNTSNWFGAQISNGNTLLVLKRVAGTITTLLSVVVAQTVVDTWYTLRLAADVAGRFLVWFGAQGDTPALIGGGSDAVLATGGALASGQVGFYDEQPSVAASTRQYDSFKAWPLNSDAVLFASKHAEVRFDQIVRETAAGTLYGPVAQTLGDLVRIPPSGAESRKVEVFVKPSRGNLDVLADDGLDSITAQVVYRPSYLFVGA